MDTSLERYRRMMAAIQDSVHVKLQIAARHTDTIIAMVEMLLEAFRNGKKVVLFGNGGSAADAQHVAAEFVNRFLLERSALPAIALSTDTSILTATGNDYRFDDVFARQVNALVNAGDVVVGISTSGNSENVLNGLRAARRKGAHSIGLTGANGGLIKDLVDICFQAPSNHTPRIQEAHITVWHIVCELVEAEFFRYRTWAVFLDRDGTLNREVDYLGDPQQLEILPGVPEGLRTLREAGARLVVVTNQAGVARGYYSERDVHRVHAALREQLSRKGVQLDEVYYCPHHPAEGRGHYKKDCPNRKPNPGMLLQAQRDFNLDLTRSFIVGDKLSDLLAGRRAGCRTVLVLTGYGEQTRAALDERGFRPDFVARNLQQAAAWILANRPIPVAVPRKEPIRQAERITKRRG